eukprot:Rmarinus@m.8449
MLLNCYYYSVCRGAVATVLVSGVTAKHGLWRRGRVQQCITRIQAAKKCGKVLPGGGVVEVLCARRLRSLPIPPQVPNRGQVQGVLAVLSECILDTPITPCVPPLSSKPPLGAPSTLLQSVMRSSLMILP